MKIKLTLIALVFLFIGSCNSGENKDEEVVHETVFDTVSANVLEDSARSVINRPSLWTVEFQGNTQIEKLKKPADTKLEALSASQLISALNENFSDVQLHYSKISHDTIYVTIPDSKKLTQEMGSTGAYNYMAASVYNLTELKNVKYVNFDFKEGDHAGPGVFSRDDFKKLR
jgi:hypothetical protein